MDDKREIKIESKTFRKLENFWYYYKWHTIVSLFLAFVIVVCTVQACSREKEDIRIIYAGGSYVEGEYHREISKALSSVLPEDFDGDGKEKRGFCELSDLLSRGDRGDIAPLYKDNHIR